MTQPTKILKDTLLHEIQNLLQSEQLPFSAIVVLYEDNLIEVFNVPDGWPAGTMQLRVHSNGMMTANLTWTMNVL